MANNEREDMEIGCIECNTNFTLTVNEMNWYDSKGFDYPKRCPTCRDIKKERNAALETEKENEHTCIRCEGIFLMRESQEKWYKDRGWELPKRCPKCIEELKLEKDAKKEKVSV